MFSDAEVQIAAAAILAPAYVAPGGKVGTPYFVFVPQVDQKQAVR